MIHHEPFFKASDPVRRRPTAKPAPVHPPPRYRLQRDLGNTRYLRLAAGSVVQRACGCGGTCSACSGSAYDTDEVSALQPKLTVGPANDAYEREADAVADAVMRIPETETVRRQPIEEEEEMLQPKLQRQPIEEEEEMLQPKPLVQRAPLEGVMETRTPGVLRTKRAPGEAPPVTPGVAADIQTLRGGGRRMDAPTRDFFESRFNTDFNGVRVHTGPRAARAAHAVKARAFTLGSDIVFGEGQYRPAARSGRQLLAHELVHVIQQGGGQANRGSVAPTVSRLQRSAVMQRAVTPELDQVEDYLWRRKKFAVNALDLLKTLPRYQQGVFFANAKQVARLRRKLPDDRVAELDALQQAAAPVIPSAQIIEDIRSLFRWGFRKKEAVEALDLLKQLSGVQLAVALGTIDYARLLHKLPEDRKQEMTDLIARGLATGGTRTTEQQQHPGTAINSLAFKDDHGKLTDQTKSWEEGGTAYPEPEWSIGEGRVKSYPISQTMGTPVRVDLNVNVLPATASPAPITLIGKGSHKALNFSYSGTLKGGRNQTLKMTSKNKLPDEKIEALEDEEIVWVMDWQGWKHEVGRTGPHTIFVTMDAPRLADEEVTHKRMKRAVEMAAEIGTLKPHDLVRGIMRNWGAYNLNVALGNVWMLADDLGRAAQCLDIVRFVEGVIKILGVPGTATAMVIYAMPDAPTKALEAEWGSGYEGLMSVPHKLFDGRRAFLRLIDRSGCPNQFEAALKFEHDGTLRYYPGGVSMDKEYKDITQVLHIFQCLAWRSNVERMRPTEENRKGRIEKVEAVYKGSLCTEGAIMNC